MMKHFIFSIFCFICLSCSDEHLEPIEEIPFGTDTSLDIITWNIENFPKHSSTIEYVVDLITALNPDIIALQEISSENEFELLISLLGQSWAGYQSEENGLAYLININNINIVENPYSILEQQQYYFAYRPPYVLSINFDGKEFMLIDVHYKCCGDGIIETDSNDEEHRRLMSNYYLKEYIDTYFSNQHVIVLGDFNDELVDIDENNVFLNFLNDENYYFCDIDIAMGSTENWSYPGWPSHLDHILIYNHYLQSQLNTQTLKLDDYLIGGWDKYNNYISDHRPVGVNIVFD